MKIIDNNEPKLGESTSDYWGFEFMFGPVANGIITLYKHTITLGIGKRDEDDEQIITNGFTITFTFNYKKYVDSGSIGIDQFIRETKNFDELFTHEIQREGEVSDSQINKCVKLFYGNLRALDYISHFYNETPRLAEEVPGIHEPFAFVADQVNEVDRLKEKAREGFREKKPEFIRNMTDPASKEFWGMISAVAAKAPEWMKPRIDKAAKEAADRVTANR